MFVLLLIGLSSIAIAPPFTAAAATVDSSIWTVDGGTFLYMASSESPSPDAELRGLRPEWEVDPTEPMLIASQVIARPDVAGTWLPAAREGQAELSLTRLQQGLYDLKFRTAGCLGHWELHRLARYSSGVLTLNYPVEQYNLKERYQKLFVVAIDGEDFLLPTADVPTYLRFLRGEERKRNPIFTLAYYSTYLPRHLPGPPLP